MQRLGDYIKEYSARNKLDEEIPVYSVTNSNGFCRDYFGKEVASNNKRTYKIVPRNAFAYNPSRINVGSVDYQHYEDRVIVSPLYNVFTVDERILPQYLYFYLKNPNTIKKIRTVASGSVRDNLKLSMLCEFPIHVPSIDKQQNIIEILEKTQRIINKKNDKLVKLDNLVKARFVEMFGDKDFEKKPFKDVCEELFAGGDVKRDRTVKDADSNHSYPVFTNGEKDGGLYGYTDVARVTKPSITISGRGTIGFCLVRAEPFYPAIRLIVAIPKENLVTPSYLKYFIDSKDYSGRGASIPQLTIPMIKDEPVPIPPIKIQKEFESIVAQVDKSKFAVQKSLEKTQLLFDSLMQEYFG